MNSSIRSKLALIYLPLMLMVAASVLTCSNPQTVNIQANPGTAPGTTTIQTPEVLPDNRVEVVYFHTPWRCATCLCFEERISHVVNTNFQNELTSGKLTFTICDISDRSKTALIRRYDAFASQFFVNTVINNTDNMVNIEDIWEWPCERDKQGFEARVRDIIGKALIEIR